MSFVLLGHIMRSQSWFLCIGKQQKWAQGDSGGERALDILLLAFVVIIILLFSFVQLPPPQFLSLIEPTVVLLVTLKQVSPTEEYVNVP